jgi:hypothetical protein
MGSVDRSARSGLVCRCHVYSDASRLSLPPGGDGLGDVQCLARRLSNTMDVAFCVAVFWETLMHFGLPEIFNTDQSLILQKRGVVLADVV